MTILELLRSRLTADPSDATLIQSRLELDDASDWLRCLAKLPKEVRIIALTFPLLLKNEESQIKGESFIHFKERLKLTKGE